MNQVNRESGIDMKIIDWLVGKGNRPIDHHDIPLNLSVEHEIAKSIVTRHQLEKKVKRYYPLIADLLVPYDNNNEDKNNETY